MNTKRYYTSVIDIVAQTYAFIMLVRSVAPTMVQYVKSHENSSKAVVTFITNFGGDNFSVIDPEGDRLIPSILKVSLKLLLIGN